MNIVVIIYYVTHFYVLVLCVIQLLYIVCFYLLLLFYLLHLLRIKVLYNYTFTEKGDSNSCAECFIKFILLYYWSTIVLLLLLLLLFININLAVWRDMYLIWFDVAWCQFFYSAMLCRARLCHSMSSVRLSVVSDVQLPWSHRLKYFENNFTAK